MRPVWVLAVGLVLAASSAYAQAPPAQTLSLPNPSIQATPLPPLQQQIQQGTAPPAPDVRIAPDTPDSPAPADTQGQTQATPIPPPVQWPNVWLPAGVAKLEALDKVNAQSTALLIPVGKSATFGSLTITVKACEVRPPDQPADAAAFLEVTDSHPELPGFQGWMLEQEPSVSMLQNPVFDIRVSGCS